MASADLSEQGLLRALRAGEAEAVVALFDGATDKERAGVRPTVEKAVESLRWVDPRDMGPRVQATLIAMYACYNPPKLRAEQWRLSSFDVPSNLVVRALGGRTVGFKKSLAKMLLVDEWTRWALVRALVKGGVIDPSIDDDGYVRLMVHGLEGGIGISGLDDSFESTTYDRLLGDPALLEREVWRMFEVPDAIGQDTGEGGWLGALFRLSAEGRVPRDRLLDACCSALATDFRPGALRWFVTLWERLTPNDAELTTRRDRVLGLVTSSDSSVAKLGLEAVKRLDGTVGLDRDAAAELLRSPLSRSRKNLAVAALDLLDRWAREADDAAHRDRFLAVVASALAHQRADVAERALTLLRRLARPPGEELRLELLEWVDAAPPALRASVAELAGVAALATSQFAARPRPRQEDLRPPIQPGPEAGLTADRLLEAVVDVDELVALLAAALESEGTAVDFERAVHGVLRRAGAIPPALADAVSPIRKRALQLADSHGHASTTALAGVVLAWTDRRLMPSPGRARQSDDRPSLVTRLGLRRRVEEELPATPGWFLHGRLTEVMRALAKGESVQALSEPTHLLGRLDPETFRSRCGGRAPVGLGPYDRRQATLRMADPHGWDHPLRLKLTLEGDQGAKGNPSALGFQPPEEAVGPRDGLIDAAVHYFGLSGKDRYHAGVFGKGWDLDDALGTRLGISTYAARPDVPAAWGALAVAERSQQAMAMWFDPLPMIEALVDATVPVDGPATTLLALALSASTQFRAAAVDVAFAAVEDGRFDPIALARDAAELHAANLLVLTRLSQPIADLAASGPLHLLSAQRFLVALVLALPGRPAGLHGPLETLAQLSAGGIDLSEDAHTVLSALARQSSKAGKAARTVLGHSIDQQR